MVMFLTFNTDYGAPHDGPTRTCRCFRIRRGSAVARIAARNVLSLPNFQESVNVRLWGGGAVAGPCTVLTAIRF